MGNVMPLTPIEKLSHSTIRIETDLATGTGFFFKFKEKDDGRSIPAIVTNKHVVKDAKTGEFVFTKKRHDGAPDIGSISRFSIHDFETKWIMHPEPEVDLCILPIGGLLNTSEQLGKSFFFLLLGKSLLPTPADLDDLIGLESITMIGYPNGIWDENNNFPVFRKGTLASNIKYDWNGKKKFIIDCAVFPGSSGSPIFILDLGGFISKSGVTLGQGRIKLIGVIHAVFLHTAIGKVEVIDIPTKSVELISSQVPNNLGIAIKSERLLDFESMLPDF